MTRKDSVLIAAALANARLGVDNPAVSAGINRAANEIADALAQSNPRFDRARFLRTTEGRAS